MNSRAVAASIVDKWLKKRDFPDRLIGSVTADRPFVIEVVYGVARWKRMLEWVITRYVRRPPHDNVMPYLLVGLYQILVMDTVASYAAVNETVKAVKAGLARNSAGFVNGVLRRVLRELETIRKELEIQDLGIRESHPDLLVKKWTQRFGAQKTLELCRWNNTRAQVTIRPNRWKTDIKNLLAALRSAGVNAAHHPFAPGECVALPHGTRVTDMPGYAEGLFSIQDPSTVAAVNLLDPRPGEFILDACAAPGGKTVLIAEMMKDPFGKPMAGKGRIIAMDLYEERLVRLRENLQRMKLDSIEVVQGDASFEQDMKRTCRDKPYDRILLDVPCTNTGVLRRRPDVRWRFSARRLKNLMNVQRSLLDCASHFLKPDGLLVYSTCSLEPEECDEMVQSWLSENPGFELVRSVNLFPPESQTDGIYAAALRGNASSGTEKNNMKEKRKEGSTTEARRHREEVVKI